MVTFWKRNCLNGSIKYTNFNDAKIRISEYVTPNTKHESHEFELELRYLETVQMNLQKGIWVDLLPLKIPKPHGELTDDLKIYFIELDEALDNLKSMITHYKLKLDPFGYKWFAPKVYDAGCIKVTNFDNATITITRYLPEVQSEEILPFQYFWVAKPADDFEIMFENYDEIETTDGWHPPQKTHSGSIEYTNFEDAKIRILRYVTPITTTTNVTKAKYYVPPTTSELYSFEITDLIEKKHIKTAGFSNPRKLFHTRQLLI